jgi:uncharacterized damage-inducible protein DinB
MPNEHEVIQQTITRALSGKDAHVENTSIFAGLDWNLAGARPQGAPHSLFELANHMIYWQEWAVKWLDGKRPRAPKHAAGGWPGNTGPANQKEWEKTVKRFCNALASLNRRSRKPDPLSRRGKMTRFEMLHIIGSHTSYHAGQVVFLRQLLSSWPPPSGGATW